MNVKELKAAIAVKCRQCVGPRSVKYEATAAELIDVCTGFAELIDDLKSRRAIS
jgi:hypothetical protein